MLLIRQIILVLVNAVFTRREFTIFIPSGGRVDSILFRYSGIVFYSYAYLNTGIGVLCDLFLCIAIILAFFSSISVRYFGSITKKPKYSSGYVKIIEVITFWFFLGVYFCLFYLLWLEDFTIYDLNNISAYLAVLPVKHNNSNSISGDLNVYFIDAHSNRKQITAEIREKSGVYCWTHRDSGKMYIGSSIELGARFRQYFSKAKLKKDNPPGGRGGPPLGAPPPGGVVIESLVVPY